MLKSCLGNYKHFYSQGMPQNPWKMRFLKVERDSPVTILRVLYRTSQLIFLIKHHPPPLPKNRYLLPYGLDVYHISLDNISRLYQL